MPPWALKWAMPVAGYLLAAILGWRLLGAHERIGELEFNLAAQADETREAADANAATVAALRQLQAQNKAMIDARRAEQARTEAELEARERAAIIAREEADRLRSERDALIQDDPTCQAHSRQVLADSCPAIADRMRERSLRAGGDTN